MKKEKSIFRRIISFMIFVASIVILIYVYNIYKTKDFNDFVRAEKSPYTSEFKRDKEVKLGENASYKIESDKFNDAMFYKVLKVEPNTPYKITCMVKTENVENLINNQGGGAQIAIESSTERTKSITGTNDWQQLVLYFNSKNRTEVNVGFRLGGYDNESKGSAWFTNITCEIGAETTNSTWNFVCFIFKNLNVNLIENSIAKSYNFTLNNDDISLIKENMQRFKTTCEELSQNKMKIDYDIIEIEDSITSVSFDTENAYYINPTDVEKLIEKYIENKEYDHIFAAVRMGDLAKNIEIPVNDWIGLGGMDYHNIGFSNIRMPNDRNSYMYRYDTRINQFPEEVFLHEFLHTLERNLQEYGYEIPALHDYKQYGYEQERLISLKKWYKDYMQKNIDFNGTKVGLDPIVYSIKPVHESDFKYSYKIDIENEPQNIIEEIRSIFKNLINVLTQIKEVGQVNFKI